MTEAKERKPSDVFLALWRYRAYTASVDVQEFSDLAEVWQQIRELETIATGKEMRRAMALLEQFLGGAAPKAPVPEVEPDPDDGKSLRCAQDDSEPESETEQETVSEPDHPMTDGDGELEPIKAKAPKRSAKEIGAESFATRKRNILAALAKARADNVSLGDIASGASGLTLNDVLDILDAKAKPVVTWAALEKALKKLGYPSRAGKEKGT